MERTSFWMDSWLGEGAVRGRFLQIFDIARCKDISVDESSKDFGGGREW